MKLSLIDLSSIFWSSWHATAGKDIDAAARVSLERVQERREGFDAVVVCCDVGKTWRHDLFPQYKANRPPRDAAAYDQLRRVREQLEADGVPVVAVETFEADDVIATLALKAPAAGYDVVIHSADKDLCQLVGPAVTVHSTTNGATVYDAAKVEERFRVQPSQLGDFLALVGDKSDNIPGLPGCGEVNAARLLNELGSLANMLEAPDAVTPPKMREALLAHRQHVLLARKLVTLKHDVPIDFAEAIKPREPKPLDEPVDEKQLGGERSPSTPPAAMTKVEPERDEQDGPAPAPGPIVLDKGDPRWSLALEPANAKAAYQFAKALHQSQLYRKFPNADAIFAVILRGRSLGIDMMTALDSMHVVEGKPALAAMTIIGIVLASGKAEYFDLVESTDTSATWETLRKGSRNKPVRMSFTIEDAKRAGLVKSGSNWEKRPRPMLRKQAGVELARSVYPDVVSNVYDPDELVA